MVNFENGVTPLNDTNLIKMQQDIGTIVSPTEPQGAERLKVWIKKGKNLFDGNYKENYGYDNSTGAVVQITTVYSNQSIISIPLGATKLILSKNGETKNTRFFFYNESKTYITSIAGLDVLIPENARYINFQIAKDTVNNDFTKIQVETENLTSYEAYIEPKIYVLNNNNVYEEFKKEVETDWINLISGYNTFYRKINRIVEINLNIYDSAGFSVEETVNKLLGTLPEGFRPSKDINIPVFSRTIGGVFTNPLRLIVKTTGEVNIYNWGTTLKFEVIQAYLTYNV